jgi:C-terminal processing protease CtpA/Prc
MAEGEHLKRGVMGVLPALEPVDTGGVRVARVVPHSPAHAARIQQGDVITAIDGKPVADTHHMLRRLAHYAAGDALTLSVTRDEAEPFDAQLTLETGPFKPDKSDKADKEDAGEDGGAEPADEDGDDQPAAEDAEQQDGEDGEEVKPEDNGELSA